MIDYDTPDPDPIVAQVRSAREAYASRFNYDLRAMFEELKKREASSGRQCVNPSQPALERLPSTGKGTAA